jgi:hypothetical protein
LVIAPPPASDIPPAYVVLLLVPRVRVLVPRRIVDKELVAERSVIVVPPLVRVETSNIPEFARLIGELLIAPVPDS